MAVIISCTVGNKPVIAQDSADTGKPIQVLLGYWNDNFYFDKEINRLLDAEVFSAEDDYVTSSFWLRFSFGESGKRWIIDQYLNILTLRQSNIRTDLYMLRMAKELNYWNGRLRIGGVLAASGNFGGEDIQNFYHRVQSIDELNLPYSSRKYIGLGVLFNYKRVLYSHKQYDISGSSSILYLTGEIPGSADIGASLNYSAIENILGISFYTGYGHYFDAGSIFTNFFDAGITWGVIANLKLFPNFQISTWLTGNQYGRENQNHFGLSFTFGSTTLSRVEFEDIK